LTVSRLTVEVPPACKLPRYGVRVPEADFPILIAIVLPSADLAHPRREILDSRRQAGKCDRKIRFSAARYSFCSINCWFTRPVPQAKLENQGELFFNYAGDHTTQTRTQHLATGKLTFHISPPLSFSPTYQMILYENKVRDKLLWQEGATLTLDYQLHWSNKRITGTQLCYRNPPSQ